MPTTGPPALAGVPNDFATLAQAEARIAEITAGALIPHHTHLDVLAYEGPIAEALSAAGVLR